MNINAATKNQNDNNSLIPVTLTESIHNCKSKYVNIKNDNNKYDGTPIHLYHWAPTFLKKPEHYNQK